MEQEIAHDIELEIKKVERKDVDAKEESKVSSPEEEERPTPTYKVMTTTTWCICLYEITDVPYTRINLACARKEYPEKFFSLYLASVMF